MSTITQFDAGNNYRDPLDMFADREEILVMFQQALRSAQRGRLHPLVVKGNSGTGKTFLISYLANRICPQLGWPTGLLTFVQSTPDFRTILEGLEDALKSCVPLNSLRLYRDKREEYKRRFDEYRASITINQTVEAREYALLSEINQSVQVNTELRRRELQLRTELCRALVELAEECERPLCLFIDGYERLAENDPELVGWLWEEVILKLVQSNPQPFLIVTCGWEWPSSPVIQPFTEFSELDNFDVAHMRNYLHKQGLLLVNSPVSTQEELITVFYDLTKGHPLVLSLAVTYFKELDTHERTPQGLRADRPLLDEKARVAFLQERLLSRLKEPFRTLLEHGPILRFFDQASLQVLLRVETGNVVDETRKLDDRTYDSFLRYPFIRQLRKLGNDSAQVQLAFQELVRLIGLAALRRHHPETKEKLHIAMANYYSELAETEWKEKVFPMTDNMQSLEEMPEKVFTTLLEWFYHVLQVKEHQAGTFRVWKNLTGQAITKWRHGQAASLLAVVQQLVEEGEPFLSRTSEPYGQYLLWYANLLEHEAHWEKARLISEEAVRVFEQLGDPINVANSYGRTGRIYRWQRNLNQAMDYFEKALKIFQQEHIPHQIAVAFQNIGHIHQQQGHLKLSSYYFEEACNIFGQENSSIDSALCLNSLAGVYILQGNFEQALNFCEQALSICNRIGVPDALADCLNTMGFLYHNQGIFEQALSYYKRVQALNEQVDNLIGLTGSLNNIASVYIEQGELEQALSYCERVFDLCEQVGDPGGLAVSLHNFGTIRYRKGKIEEAIGYFERALTLFEQEGNIIHIITSLNHLGDIHQEQGYLEKSLIFYERALALSKEVDDSSNTAARFIKAGLIYRQQGKLSQALKCYKRALVVFEEIGDLAYIATIFHNIGSVYLEWANIKRAIEYASKALSVYERLGEGFESHVADELESLAFCYSRLGEVVKSITFYAHAEQIRKKTQKTK